MELNSRFQSDPLPRCRRLVRPEHVAIPSTGRLFIQQIGGYSLGKGKTEP
jgi:hypothetical protein